MNSLEMIERKLDLILDRLGICLEVDTTQYVITDGEWDVFSGTYSECEDFLRNSGLSRKWRIDRVP